MFLLVNHELYRATVGRSFLTQSHRRQRIVSERREGRGAERQRAARRRRTGEREGAVGGTFLLDVSSGSLRRSTHRWSVLARPGAAAVRGTIFWFFITKTHKKNKKNTPKKVETLRDQKNVYRRGNWRHLFQSGGANDNGTTNYSKLVRSPRRGLLKHKWNMIWPKKMCLQMVKWGTADTPVTFKCARWKKRVECK